MPRACRAQPPGYRTQDGRWVALSAGMEGTLARLFEGIGRPEALSDPRFTTHEARPRHIDALDDMIQAHVGGLTLEEALRFFAERDISAGPVCDVADLLQHPYLRERELLVQQPTPDGRSVPVHAAPYRIDGLRPPIRRPAPALGQDHARWLAVRVNGDLLTLAQDLRAAVRPGLELLVLPQVEHARDVQAIAAAVATLEAEHGMPAGHVRLLLQIESAAALPRLHDIAAAHPRVMGMMLGSEDFSLDLGGLPGEDLLLAPSLLVLHAARAAGIQPIGFVASIATLGDVDEFRRVLERARGLGFRGAVIVHPKFIEAVNDCCTPSPGRVAAARAIVEAFESADRQGLGAVRVGELMVDMPVWRRSRQLLAEAGEST